MAEQHDLTIPIPSTGGTSFWKFQHLVLHYDGDESYVKVGLVGENGEGVSVGYEGIDASALIRQINTLNFSSTSLQKRLMERLATDGKIASGDVTGTADV